MSAKALPIGLVEAGYEAVPTECQWLADCHARPVALIARSSGFRALKANPADDNVARGRRFAEVSVLLEAACSEHRRLERKAWSRVSRRDGEAFLEIRLR